MLDVDDYYYGLCNDNCGDWTVDQTMSDDDVMMMDQIGGLLMMVGVLVMETNEMMMSLSLWW